MTEPNLQTVEALLKLMTKHQADSIELTPDGGIKISKKLHYGPKLPKKTYAEPPVIHGASVLSDEDVMFAATSAPKMSLEDFTKFSANKPQEP